MAEFSSEGFSPPPITDAEYEFICKLVYEHSRIKLGDHKRELVMARLGKRLRELGLKTFTDYCQLMRSARRDEELGDLIDAISTNHTFFFREKDHFDFLESKILPTHRSGLRVWSAACSSGEEAYSVAIILAEHLGVRGKWAVDCTDISGKILKKAAEGIFSIERLQQVPPGLVDKYFQKGAGESEGLYRTRNELKSHLTFQRVNLLGPRYPFSEPYDVVFCRNVMIYFDKPTQSELTQKMIPLIKPGGWLFIGHAESLTGTAHKLKMIKPAIYQKV